VCLGSSVKRRGGNGVAGVEHFNQRASGRVLVHDAERQRSAAVVLQGEVDDVDGATRGGWSQAHAIGGDRDLDVLVELLDIRCVGDEIHC
jgi:hypothetical protein